MPHVLPPMDSQPKSEPPAPMRKRDKLKSRLICSGASVAQPEAKESDEGHHRRTRRSGSLKTWTPEEKDAAPALPAGYADMDLERLEEQAQKLRSTVARRRRSS